MKSVNALRSLTHIGLALAFGVLPTFSARAQILWNTPVASSGDSDVVTNGTPLYAYDYANSGQTVNGVNFIGASTANAGGDVGTTLTTFNQVAFTAAGVFTSLPPEYQSILVGAAYASSASSFTVTLSNLAGAHQYVVQFWVNDPRSAEDTRTVTLSSVGGNSVLLQYCAGQVAGNPGQYAVGLFTASGATQTFTLVGTTGSVPQMNAIQVLDVTGFNAWGGYVNNTWDYTTTNWGTGQSLAAVSNVFPLVNFADSNGFGAAVTANVIGIQAAGVTIGNIDFLNNSINYTITNAPATPGLTGASAVNVLGSGVVTFTGPNTYTGATTVRSGTLVVNGSLGAGAVTVNNGGTLMGTGAINGATAVQSGGTLSVGTGSTPGTLTINNTLSLAGVTLMRISKNGSSAASDKVAGTTGVTFGGTLVVTNVTSEGSLLAAGDTFTLFPGSSIAGSFTSVVLPAVSGLNWDQSQLQVNGSIALVDSAPPPAFSPLPGTYYPLSYPQGQNVTLTSSGGSTIFYTTNGATPTPSSPNGASPVTIPLPPGNTITIKAYAVEAGFPNSAVASGVYTVVSASIWDSPTGGAWSTSTDWLNSIVANGSGQGADFGELTLPANLNVTLDSSRVVGSMNFGDVGQTYNTSILPGAGTTLTLNAGANQPVITVSNETATLAVPVAGASGLAKAGSGTLIISTNNTYTGGTVINQGFIEVSNITGTLGSGATGNVVLNGGGIDALFPSTTTTVTETWPINVGPSGGEIDLLQTASEGRWSFTANTLTGTGTLTIKPGATRYVIGDQNVSGFSGKWVLDGTNPNGGQGYINLGDVNGDLCFGASPQSFEPDAVTVKNNADFLSANPGTALSCSAGSATRGWTIGSGGGIIEVAGANVCMMNCVISGTTGDPVNFAANNNNAGIQLNAPCTYNGNTVVDNAGTAANKVYLRMGVNNALPNGPGMGLLAYSAGTGILDLNGFTATINGFGGNNSTSLVDSMTNAASSTLTVGAGNVTSSFAGVIQNTAGTVNLIKSGTGALTLTGANTYNGSTTVSGGELVISQQLQLGGGSYSVADGATLDINNVNSSFAPISMSALTLGSNSGAALELDFSSSPPGSAPIQATSLTANAVTLNLNFGGGVTVGQYPLIQYSGAIGGAGFSAFKLVTPPDMTANLVNDTGNNSVDVNVTVAPTVSVALTSSVNPSVLGQPVVFDATATTLVGGSNVPGTGSVTFKNGTVTLGSATLNASGVAALTNSFSTISTNSITAIYEGASSLAVSQVVNPGLAIWSGAKNNVWDIATTTNWLTLGSPTTYYNGDSVQFDDTALSNTTITLSVKVNPTSVTASNNGKNYSLSGTGSISGAAGLTTVGTGTLTVSTTNNYTGNTVVSNGVLTFSGAGSTIGTTIYSQLFVGDGSGDGILNMNSTGALWFATYESLGGITGDANDTGSGAVYQTAGTINLDSSTGGAGAIAFPFEIGAGGPSAYGYYSLSGGTLTSLPYLSPSDSISVGAIGQGVFVQTGGILNEPGYLDLGTYSGTAGNGGTGVATFTGGTATIGTAIRLGVEPNGNGVMNMGTEAGGTATVIDATLELLAGTTATNAVLNLDSGTLQLTSDIYKNTANSGGTDLLNLNGGKLQAAASAALIGAVDSVLLFNGGVVMDTQTYTVTDAANMQAPSGNGIYPNGGVLTIASGGGSNYIGAPLVAVSGGSGIGAMAIATVSNGVVTNVTLTCPGQNYVAGDILSFAFAGGGTSTPAGTFNYTLKAGDVEPNSLGQLTKIGSGTLTLTGNSGYTNNTLVNNGTLEVDGSLGGGVIVANGTLDGSGYIYGAVTVQNGSALGAGSSAVIGQLNLYSTLSLSGTASLRLNKTGGTLVNDYVQGLNSVDYGGALTVTNVTTDGNPLALGDQITLFSSRAYSGSFSTVNLPAFPGGLTWDISDLAVNGSIMVTNAPILTGIAVSGTTLTLSATNGTPGGQYVLLSATNLATPFSQWTPILTNHYDGSGNLNLSTNVINPAVRQEFYLLSQ